MSQSRDAYVTKTNELNAKKRDKINSIAIGETMKACVVTTTISGIVTYIASQRSAAFNKAMSVSAKASIPVMTCLFTFGLVSELTVHSVNRDPSKYGLYASIDEEMEAKRISNSPKANNQFYVPAHHIIANRIAGAFSLLLHSIESRLFLSCMCSFIYLHKQ